MLRDHAQSFEMALRCVFLANASWGDASPCAVPAPRFSARAFERTPHPSPYCRLCAPSARCILSFRVLGARPLRRAWQFVGLRLPSHFNGYAGATSLWTQRWPVQTHPAALKLPGKCFTHS